MSSYSDPPVYCRKGRALTARLGLKGQGRVQSALVIVSCCPSNLGDKIPSQVQENMLGCQ
jgi:hypothetical protein